VETVLGIQFDPIQNWSLLDFGLLWNELKDDYPMHETKPPVGVPDAGEVIFQFNGDNQLPLRLWLHHKDGKKLIQVQTDRFLHNWRKYVPDQPYPRYSDSIRPSFELEWKRFTNFLESRNMSVPNINSCEIAYVNRFEESKEWNSLDELPRIVNLWAGTAHSSFLPTPSLAAFQTVYPLENIVGGSLSVTCQPVSEKDGKRSFHMVLQVSGQVKSSNLEDVLYFFDSGHKWIVETFDEITTSSMHNLWQRQG